jgi:hypothetical protein
MAKIQNMRILSTAFCHSERSEESRPFAVAQGDKTNNFKIQNMLEHWDLGFVWDLGFRAWNLRKKEVMKCQTK